MRLHIFTSPHIAASHNRRQNHQHDEERIIAQLIWAIHSGAKGLKKIQYASQDEDRILLQEVVRPLSVDERTLILATAVSIDFDYFSQHSHGSGLLPFGLMPFPGAPPVPYPSGGGEGEDAPAAGQEAEGAFLVAFGS